MLTTSLYILAILLQAADAYTTYRILSGGGRELNKLLAWIFGKVGMVPGLIGTKLVLVGMMTLLVLRGGVFTLPLLIIICVVYTGVVIYNLRSVK